MINIHRIVEGRIYVSDTSNFGIAKRGVIPMPF